MYNFKQSLNQGRQRSRPQSSKPHNFGAQSVSPNQSAARQKQRLVNQGVSQRNVQLVIGQPHQDLDPKEVAATRNYYTQISSIPTEPNYQMGSRLYKNNQQPTHYRQQQQQQQHRVGANVRGSLSTKRSRKDSADFSQKQQRNKTSFSRAFSSQQTEQQQVKHDQARHLSDVVKTITHFEVNPQTAKAHGETKDLPYSADTRDPIILNQQIMNPIEGTRMSSQSLTKVMNFPTATNAVFPS